jgi:DNA-binding transcriptional ArsR family regulator
MEEKAAVEALAALAQEHRLKVFRRLVREGTAGMTAGAIAEWLGVPASSLSFHLAHLERAGLIRSWRVARNIYYALDIEGARRLLGFLTEECCQGHPEICGYARRGTVDDDDDLPQPGLRDVPERAGDDPEQRRGAAGHRVPEDATEPS